MRSLILPVEALTDPLARRSPGGMFHVKPAHSASDCPPSVGILGPPPRRRPSRAGGGRGTQISYVAILLAVLIGILHAAAAPVLTIGDVHPNFMLVAVVLVTVIKGFGPGVAWAFIGGLTANLLTREPLGSIPLGLLLVAAAVAGGERLFGRLSWGYPVAAVGIGSVIVDAISLAVMQMVDPPAASQLPLQRILAAGLLNAVIAAIVILPARVLVGRGIVDEKAAW
jgi:rod shape-determining protein MreD